MPVDWPLGGTNLDGYPIVTSTQKGTPMDVPEEFIGEVSADTRVGLLVELAGIAQKYFVDIPYKVQSFTAKPVYYVTGNGFQNTNQFSHFEADFLLVPDDTEDKPLWEGEK